MTIKKIREKSGLTQQEFADKLEVSVSAVQRWEQGSRVPGRRTMRDIKMVFGNTSLAKATLTGFDYEDKPGEKYLRLTFDIPKSDIPGVVKSLVLVLGKEFTISDVTV